MNIGIIGSRRRDTNEDLAKVNWVLVDILAKHPEIKEFTIISGGCPKGGDRFAEILAERYDIPIIIHYPDKSKLGPGYNNRWAYAQICYARNTLIAKDSDILIACVAEDRKGGTEDTIRKFGKKGELIIV